MATITLENVPDDLMAELNAEARRSARDVRDVAIARLRAAAYPRVADLASLTPIELAERSRRVTEFRDSLAAKGVMIEGDIKEMVERGRP